MKAIATFALVLIAFITNAQLTAADLISKANCTEKECFSSLFISKGFTEFVSPLSTTANAYKYTAKDDCGTTTSLVAGIAAKGFGYSLIVKCERSFTSYIADFEAEGYKAAGSAGGTITVGDKTVSGGKYTSTTHPGVVMYLSEGKGSGKGTYTIKVQAE